MSRKLQSPKLVCKIVVEKFGDHNWQASYEDMNAFAVLRHECGTGSSMSDAILNLIFQHPRREAVEQSVKADVAKAGMIQDMLDNGELEEVARMDAE